MAIFSRGMPRGAVLLFAVGAFCIFPPEVLAKGPDLCLWRNLFHLSACPACGTTRALAALFHGQFARALAFNRNVVITGPGLLWLLARDALEVFNRGSRRGARLELASLLRCY